MADYSPTAANVIWNSGKRPRIVKGGASIAAGNILYKDTSDDEWKKYIATSDPTNLDLAMALSDGQDGRDMLIVEAGANVNIGFTTTAGTPIAASGANAGETAPETDLGTGDYYVLIAIGDGTANVNLQFVKGEAAHA